MGAELEAGGVTAVVAVDNYGTPADWTSLGEACRTARVPLILDACESLGARRSEGPAVADADLIAVSFSFTKPVHAAGMGGALIGPAALINAAASDPRHLVRQTMLPEVNAAYLVRAWPRLADNIARLRENYSCYQEVLEPLGFRPQVEYGTSTRLHAPFLIPVDAPWRRDEFLEALNTAGVGAAAQFPSQSNLLGMGSTCPTAADIAARVVSLPSGAGLGAGDAPRVANLVASVFRSR